jgi:hypothetical protein
MGLIQIPGGHVDSCTWSVRGRSRTVRESVQGLPKVGVTFKIRRRRKGVWWSGGVVFGQVVEEGDKANR